MNAWGPVLASTAVTISLAVLLWRALSSRMDDLIARMDDRFEAVERRMDDRFAALTAVMDARLETVDHRLSALETDMTIVKRHLLNTPAA